MTPCEGGGGAERHQALLLGGVVPVGPVLGLGVGGGAGHTILWVIPVAGFSA